MLPKPCIKHSHAAHQSKYHTRVRGRLLAELPDPHPLSLNIQILYGQGVTLDKLAARFNTVAHKLHKGV